MDFWDRADKSGGDAACWPWTGPTTSWGYGTFGRHAVAHRRAYELAVGPIPAGYQIDHLCRNRGCVNPTHLEAVTKRDNILRGTSPSALAARQTHCAQGHPFAGDNLFIVSGRRVCGICRRESVRRANAPMPVD